MFCLNPILRIKENHKVRELTKFEEIKYRIYLFKLANNPHSSPAKPDIYDKVIRLPCGHCDACRITQYEEWSARCWLEARQYESNLFITLTYDNTHLPQNGVDKQDISKFLHNLREYFRRKFNRTGIRFFACGEYGGKNYRAHYHLILFNCPKFGDEKKYMENGVKQVIYTSDILNQLWGKGNCTIGAVTRQSCDYVCRYLVKPSYDKKPQDQNPEFRSMSTQKGIGYDYLINNLEQIIADGFIWLTGSKKVKLSRYYDRKIEEIIGAERFKNEITIPRAEKAKAYLESEMLRTGLTEEQLNNQQIHTFNEKLKRLESNFKINHKDQL